MNNRSVIEKKQINRRVATIMEIDGVNKDSILTLEELRAYPHIVLLGEPGIGKSTALEYMAKISGANVIKVRTFMHGMVPDQEFPLFLDALDEFRSDGSAVDKTYELAKLIKERKYSQWRLTCRAEDWRNIADTSPFIEMGVSEKVLVVQLLPINYEEACLILESRGEINPREFLEQAKNLGAHGFTGNPLSLELLHTSVVKSESWPKTRFSLFEKSIDTLVREHNTIYQADLYRSSPEKIIEAAGKISFLKLLSGSSTIWRSQGATPNDLDERAFITFHDLGIDQKTFRDCLDTPIFRGEGERFEFIHRTVEEFLAGQCLALAVTANGEKSRFPLRRAIAMITGNNNKPPTELRGVFAWFAAHLAQLGDHYAAATIVEIDAFSIIGYGDAAAFDSTTRKIILQSLDRDDPYFRATEKEGTVLGGLIDESLSNEIIEILNNPPKNSHLLLTVAESLASNRPIPILQPHLKKFILDPVHLGWQRQRILEAFISYTKDNPKELRDIFHELKKENASIEREELRIYIAAKLIPHGLSTDELKILLSDFEGLPDDSQVGRLYNLEKSLIINPSSEIFESHINVWRNIGHSYKSNEVDTLLDKLLASHILSADNFNGKELWKWIVNSRHYYWYSNEYCTAANEATSQWQSKSNSRQIELYEAIIETIDSNTIPNDADRIFQEICGSVPTIETIKALVLKLKESPNEIGEWTLKTLIKRANISEPDPIIFWGLFDFLNENQKYKEHLQKLISNTIDITNSPKKEYESPEQLKERQRSRKIETLSSQIAKLKNGEFLKELYWASIIYFEEASFRSTGPVGAERLILETSPEIFDALSIGWECWTKEKILGIDIKDIFSSDNSRYYWEYAALAGLVSLTNKGLYNEIPSSSHEHLFLAALRIGQSITLKSARDSIIQWLVRIITTNPQEFSILLEKYWQNVIALNNSTLPGLELLASNSLAFNALSEALSHLLLDNTIDNQDTLFQIIFVAQKVIPKDKIGIICSNALQRDYSTPEVEKLWKIFELINFPENIEYISINANNSSEATYIIYKINDFLKFNLSNKIPVHHNINSFIIKIAGPFCTPERDGIEQLSMAVHGAINRLSSSLSIESKQEICLHINNPSLTEWRESLRHALAQQSLLRADHCFIHPKPKILIDAVAGGPPVNSSDLHAIAVEELRRLQIELHTTNTTAWKSYWNRDQNGNATKPLIENECRNHLLERLNDRLVPYKVTGLLPEAQSAEGTRVDILLMDGFKNNVPIEIKRHFHREVWNALNTQLQEYASAQGADGHGIYLVFWFGKDLEQTPSLPLDKNRPDSSVEMESILNELLSPIYRHKTEIIVFDVSRRVK